MQRAESYAALAPLLSTQLRRGVVTNCFLSAEDYQRELPRGLYYEEREGCLLLLRQRPGHLILNFYLQPGGTFFLPDVKRPVVTELSCRAKDADAMSAAPEDLPVVEMDLDRPFLFVIFDGNHVPLFVGTVQTVA